jgi:hypothetical protein
MTSSNYYIEFIGYLAILVCVFSFLFPNPKEQRGVNVIGCLLFIIYAYMIHNWVIMTCNIAMILINIRYFYLNRK